MKYRLALAHLLTIMSVGILVAQPQYPVLENVIVRADVSFNVDESIYYYTYTVANGETSRGLISRFEIDISRYLGTTDIDTLGLRFENDGFTEKNFRFDFALLTGRIIPVGYLNTPRGRWSGGNTNSLMARFSGIGEDHILPGQTLGGFELMSKGLPGIRLCIVSPYFDVIALFPDPDDTTTTYYVPPVDSVRNAVKFHTLTVGPTAPPADFEPIVWLDTLISYKHQAFDLGWITNQGIVTSLDQKLENARRQMERGNNNSARNILQAFVNEVEAQKNIHLSSEAYALLRFNAEYLISKLR